MPILTSTRYELVSLAHPLVLQSQNASIHLKLHPRERNDDMHGTSTTKYVTDGWDPPPCIIWLLKFLPGILNSIAHN